MSPLLSIVIPTYNYGHRIADAVFSVLEQMNERCELIVVDDGSTDSTASVLKTLTESAAQCFAIIRKANGGPASARNKGLQEAKGEFVLFLDADDILLPQALPRILALLTEKPDSDLLLAGHVNAFADGQEKVVHPTPVFGPPEKRVFDYLIAKRIAIGHGSSVFRRQLVALRPYPESLRQGEDIPVFAFMLARSKIAFLDIPVARIHKHADSLRHDVVLARSIPPAEFTETVFSALPADCQNMRQRYEAQRNLSLFRTCYLGGDKIAAKAYFRQAFALSPRQALHWTYLSKFVRLLLFLGTRH